VIESPKQTTTDVSGEAIASTASRKNQDVVVNGRRASLSSAPSHLGPAGVSWATGGLQGLGEGYR